MPETTATCRHSLGLNLEFARIEAGLCPECGSGNVRRVEYENETWLRCTPCCRRVLDERVADPTLTCVEVLVRLRAATDDDWHTTGEPIIHWQYVHAADPPPGGSQTIASKRGRPGSVPAIANKLGLPQS